MPSATLTFDDPNGREIDEPIPRPSDVRQVLLDLQRRYPKLNFLADIVAPGRTRFSVVLAQDHGAAIVWSDPVVRTRADTNRKSQIPVWDGAGVDMPVKYFVPLARLVPVIEEWIASGTLSRSVQWTTEDYN